MDNMTGEAHDHLTLRARHLPCFSLVSAHFLRCLFASKAIWPRAESNCRHADFQSPYLCSCEYRQECSCFRKYQLTRNLPEHEFFAIC